MEAQRRLALLPAILSFGFLAFMTLTEAAVKKYQFDVRTYALIFTFFVCSLYFALLPPLMQITHILHMVLLGSNNISSL